MRFHILDTSSSTMRPEPFAEVILNPTLLLPFGYCKAVLTVLKYKHVLEQTISMTNESFGLCIFFFNFGTTAISCLCVVQIFWLHVSCSITFSFLFPY